MLGEVIVHEVVITRETFTGWPRPEKTWRATAVIRPKDRSLDKAHAVVFGQDPDSIEGALMDLAQQLGEKVRELSQELAAARENSTAVT